MPPAARFPFLLLIAVQIVDVAIHVATDQIEPLRIASNIVISAAALVWSTFPPLRQPWVIWGAGVVYLALNMLFLGRFGLINPATESLRIPLFVFVAASVALLSWVSRAR